MRRRRTDLIPSFKSGDRLQHLVTELLGFRAAILRVELVRQSSDFFDRASNTPPRSASPRRVALAVHAEIRVVLALDQEVSPFIAIGSPGLY